MNVHKQKHANPYYVVRYYIITQIDKQKFKKQICEYFNIIVIISITIPSVHFIQLIQGSQLGLEPIPGVT